jgi:hypothetical protein
MKTNVVLQSTDRELFGINIRQETKTGFLCVSDLQEAYVHARVKNGWIDKNVSEIISRKENKERIYYIIKEQGIITYDISHFIELSELHGFTHLLKEIGVYKTTGARKTKMVYCNPYIWILIALELNPMLYAKTVIWLTDNLIINRIEAGNFYKGLSSSLQKFKNPDFVKVARALNYIVFKKHETGIRNFGTAKELKELEDIEKKMSFAIDMGYIESQEKLISELRKMYYLKWKTDILT